MSDVSQVLGPSSRLLLVDGHSLAYRAFYALPVESFSSPSGQPTNAVYGFLSMLTQVYASEQPTHLAVAWDVSRETFRRAEFPEYKATRAKTPPEFAGQVPEVKRLLDLLGITHLAVDGFEADDIIATLAKAAEAIGASVDILTGDRDTLQLVSSDITVLYPVKGVKDLARMTPEAVETKYGVKPAVYADLAALRGDTSDNLPSVPGVGDKTAATWLNQYGDLAGLIDHADELKGKVGQAFRDHVSQVQMNRRLTELVKDVPLDVDVANLWRKSVDVQGLISFFDEMGFKAQKERVWKTFSVSTEEGELSVSAERSLIGWEPGSLANALPKPDVQVGIAFNLANSELTEFALAWDENLLYVEVAEFKGSDLESLRTWLSDPARFAIGHSIKGLEGWAYRQGHSLNAVKADTELIEYLMNPGVRNLDIESVAERRLGRTPGSGESDSLFVDSRKNLTEQSAAILDIYLSLDQSREDVRRIHDEMELPLTRLLAKMEVRGIAVEGRALADLEQEFTSAMTEAEREAAVVAGQGFNLASPKQLQEILFEVRGLPKTKKIKTGYTTDAEALQSLFAATGDPVVEQILRYREVTKLKQTVAGLRPLIDSAGRVHTTFQQTVAATGRLSSSDPNLQNIPVRTEAGRRIRRAFVAGQEFEGLLTADYSQIEMRIMAHLCEDEGLIAAFNSGEDLHTTVAAEVFELEPDQVSADHRRRIKAMSYGLVYGLSAYGLSQQLGIEVREASTLMERYFERFGKVQSYLRDVVSAATRNGYTETMFGRRRYLPDLASGGDSRAAAERMALNAPIQGSAADIIKIAMLAVEASLLETGVRSRLLLQVHDELVLEVAAGERDTVEAIVRQGMGSAATLLVPLEVTVGFGRNWDEAAH